MKEEDKKIDKIQERMLALSEPIQTVLRKIMDDSGANIGLVCLSADGKRWGVLASSKDIEPKQVPEAMTFAASAICGSANAMEMRLANGADASKGMVIRSSEMRTEMDIGQPGEDDEPLITE